MNTKDDNPGSPGSPRGPEGSKCVACSSTEIAYENPPRCKNHVHIRALRICPSCGNSRYISSGRVATVERLCEKCVYLYRNSAENIEGRTAVRGDETKGLLRAISNSGSEDGADISDQSDQLEEPTEDPSETPTDSVTTKDITALLRKEINNYTAEIKRLRLQLAEHREIAETIVVSIDPLNYKIKPPRKSTSKRKPPATAVFVISDWQIGEIIKSEDVENLNAYDYAIAERRITSFADSFIRYVKLHKNIYNIDDCVILSVGDLISGDIHDELRETCEFPSPVQAAKAAQLQANIIARIADSIHHVEAYLLCVDNHGRTTKKVRFKSSGITNWSYVINTTSEQLMKRLKNVDVKIITAQKAVIDIAGWPFLLEHGHSVRSWMGIPYYGIANAVRREALKRIGSDISFRYVVLGHWHVPALLDNQIIINGCLTGTSEYDHAVGRYADPAQLGFMVSPNHGVFNLVPFVELREPRKNAKRRD